MPNPQVRNKTAIHGADAKCNLANCHPSVKPACHRVWHEERLAQRENMHGKTVAPSESRTEFQLQATGLGNWKVKRI